MELLNVGASFLNTLQDLDLVVKGHLRQVLGQFLEFVVLINIIINDVKKLLGFCLFLAEEPLDVLIVGVAWAGTSQCMSLESMCDGDLLHAEYLYPQH